jgi:O-antigen/teichoic acid export membrane protein
MGLGSGVVIAHLITLGISPLITRMYTPDQFGVFALFTSLVSILTLLSTGAYEFSIVLPEKEKTAIQLFKVSVLCSTLFSIASYLLLFFIAPFISRSPTLSLSFLFLLPLGVFFD